MSYFLIVYDRSSGEYLLRDFGTSREAALKARFDAEQASPEAEVVVLSAESRKTLERTHARYFHSTATMARAGAKKAILNSRAD